jgi:predicted ester cyclase
MGECPPTGTSSIFSPSISKSRRNQDKYKGGTAVAEAENKRLIRRYYDEVLNEGRLEVLDEIARPDHAEHNPLPGQPQGLEGLKQRVRIIKTAFDPRFTLEHVIADGDKVAVMWSNRGTHLVEWFGVPPTGRTVEIQGIDIHLIRDGRMAEHWDVVDMLAILFQIGALPAPKAVPA